MECPKCRHTIYLDLSLEDLIFCPYCDQRMIPPKEFNLCPVCSEELPVGASFCLKCGEKLVSEEKPVIDHTPVSPPDHSREDISGLANGEPPVAKEPVPVAERITALPADQFLKSIYGQPAAEQPSVAEPVKPPSLEVPASRVIPQAFVQEKPAVEPVNPENEPQAAPKTSPVVNDVTHKEEPEVIPFSEPAVTPFVEKEAVAEREPVRTTFEVDEEAEPLESESSYSASAEPINADVERNADKECRAVTPEPIEPGAPGDFGFCISCGRKLPPEALYCPRCGKSTVMPEFTGAQPEAITSSEGLRKEPVKPVNVEPVSRPEEFRETGPSEEPAPVTPPHVEPRYRPVSSREPISNAMMDVAPSMPHHPYARNSGGAVLRKIWLNVKGWTANALDAAWEFTKGQQKGFREIFSKLFEEREITPVDLSSAEALKQAAKTVAPTVKRPIPRIYIILGVIVYIVLFVVIGITISRCSSG